MQAYNNVSILSLIDSMSSQFTRTDWKIVKYIKSNPNEFLKLTASELATVIKTSDASIIRFTQKIGMNGLSEFKLKLKNEMQISDKDNRIHENLLANDYQSVINSVFNSIDNKELSSASEHIVSAQRVYIYGEQENSIFANILFKKLLNLDIVATIINDFSSLKILANKNQINDTFIIFNTSSSDKLDFIYNVKFKNNFVVFSNLIPRIKNSDNISFMQIPSYFGIMTDPILSIEIPIVTAIDILFQEVFSTNQDYFIDKYYHNKRLEDK